jgi:hypothetical protein
MAEITMTKDRVAGLTVLTVTGEVTGREIVDEIARYFTGEPTKHILWDCCEAGLKGLTASDVKVIVDETRRHTHLRPGGKTALFTCADVAYGIGRMIEQTLNATDSAVEFMSFRDRAAALAWLGAGEA